MRIQALSVSNYKGIARLEVADLASEAVVVISGRNGTGKSLLLEALVGAWTGRYNMVDRVGPWGDQMRIEFLLELTAQEWHEVDAWNLRFNGGPVDRDEELRLIVEFSRNGSGSQRSGTAIGVLRNPTFQRENPFAVVDFLPANRLVPNAPSGTVDLAMLNTDRIEQERYTMLDNFINSRAPMSLPSVSSYLITLDYQAFLAQRQELCVVDDYGILQSAFSSATGKELLAPQYDPSRGNHIQIQLPTGHRHGLGDLSSGEQEMLAMMYFVRRLSASGGVLCIDEPEQHLHPSLQASLFEAMQGLADRAQIFVVSHSVNLINTAPLSGLLQVEAPKDETTNQASRLTDAPDRVRLMGELGITGADLAQSDIVVVVEGDTDSQWLRTLFPIEFGRAHIVIAGSARQVIDAHDTLSKLQSPLPWLCIRDRDLLSDEELTTMRELYPNMHVWPRRAIESMLLDAPLAVATIHAVGRTLSPESVENCMYNAALPLKEEVLGALVEAELTRRFPPPGGMANLERFARMEAEMRAYAQVNLDRADGLQETLSEQRALLEARWKDEWIKLVNPKPVLEALRQYLGTFRTVHDLATALMAKARDDETVRPAALEDVRLRVQSALRSRAPGR